jgi:hypothetical protein
MRLRHLQDLETNGHSRVGILIDGRVDTVVPSTRRSGQRDVPMFL